MKLAMYFFERWLFLFVMMYTDGRRKEQPEFWSRWLMKHRHRFIGFIVGFFPCGWVVASLSKPGPPIWRKFIPYNQASFVTDMTEAWRILFNGTMKNWRGSGD
jgi:hypothetical protein